MLAAIGVYTAIFNTMWEISGDQTCKIDLRSMKNLIQVT